MPGNTPAKHMDISVHSSGVRFILPKAKVASTEPFTSTSVCSVVPGCFQFQLLHRQVSILPGRDFIPETLFIAH